MILLIATFSSTNPKRKTKQVIFFSLELWTSEHAECIIRFQNWNIGPYGHYVHSVNL